MKKNKLLIILMIACIAGSKAQDFHLSMYDAGPLYLNPALTGVVDAKWRLHAQYRNQWKALSYKPFNTSLISFDAPIGKWGFGGQIMNTRASIGNYNALQAIASVAYTVSLDKNKFHNLAFGLQGGLTQKTIEYKLYTFDNQYTTSSGGSFDQTLPSGEAFAAQKRILPQVNAGVLYFFSKMQSRINPFFGFSAFNLTQPKETFFNTDSKIPMRFYAHAGMRINITEQFYLIPKILVMNQLNVSEQTLALDAGYYLSTQKMYLLGGLIYRTNDAAIFSLGARFDNIITKVSYDINTSSLARASNGRGAFEVSFTYMPRIKTSSKISKACPRI